MKGISTKLALFSATLLVSSAMLTGCGSDGKDGAPGAPGQDASDVAVKTAMESCATCHGAGKSLGADVVHDYSRMMVDEVVVKDINPVASGDILTVKFKVDGKTNGYYDKLVGVAQAAGTHTAAADVGGLTYAHRRDADGRSLPFKPADSGITFDAGTGVYTLTLKVTNTARTDLNKNARYMVAVKNNSDYAKSADSKPVGSAVSIVFDYPAAPYNTGADVLAPLNADSNASQSCENCHGPQSIYTTRNFTFGGEHKSAITFPSYGGKACTVCHGAKGESYVPLPEFIHGIHNSGNMPTGVYQPIGGNGVAKAYTFTNHFPSYMQNCSTCHKAGAPLTAANDQPVSYELCMSCHQSWDSFKGDAMSYHKAFDSTTNCAGCHGNAPSLATVGAMHNNAKKGVGLTSGRGGLIIDGVDLAVQEGAKINQEITGVTRTGNKLSISWKATYNGAAVDPCNATPTTTAPAFAYAAVPASGKQLAVSAQNFSFLVGFLQGEDVVNANNGNASPGQPNAYSAVFAGEGQNTTCSANVATTTITLNDSEAKLTGNARVGLQGKPAMKAADGRVHLVRAKSPVYDFKLADGSAVKPGSAVARRAIADIDACLKCHVGSLYQHGGNRVDSVELCIICHNEASSDQNTRTDWGINKDNSYDGKVGHTYGFKSLLHKIHASGTKDKNGAYMLNPFAIYRPAQGVYGYSPSEDLLRNWPGTGSKVVFASNPEQTKNHAYVVAHYPRPLQDCSACHVKGFSVIPDPTKAVATTIDAGTAPWDNQLDDTLIGPATAACISCHTGSAAAAHAYQNSWAPAKLENGRQTVIDAAK